MRLQLFSYLKHLIKSSELLYYVYTSIRYRKIAKVRNWARKTNRFVVKNKLNTFVFYNEKIYCRVLGDAEFEYRPELLGGLLGLEASDGFETKMLKNILPVIKDCTTILDIGANFGFYSVVLSKLLNNAQIHAFEPAPLTFSHLSQNVLHNKVENNVKINNLGVAEKSGKLFITNDLYAGNHIQVSSNGASSSLVSITTVDEYVAANKLTKVDFIKCDIEGAELLMLRGAKKTIDRDKPIIFLEVSEQLCSRFGHTAEETISELTKMGYFYKVLNRAGAIVEQSNSPGEDFIKGSDFLFFHPEKP